VAAYKGNQEIIKILLAKGADINAKTAQGFTPLYVASEVGHTESAQTLIAGHADINIQISEGLTPLHIAAQNGHKQIVLHLLLAKEGMNVINRKTRTGLIPYDLALQRKHMEIASLLAEAKNTPEIFIFKQLAILNRTHENNSTHEHDQKLLDATISNYDNFLLDTFDKKYFPNQDDLARIARALLEQYLADLDTREQQGTTHRFSLFDIPSDFSTSEKKEAAQALHQAVLNKAPIEILLKLKEQYKALDTPRLSKLFEAFCELASYTSANVAVPRQQPPHLKH
jgi:ankyrin repeat protein